MTRPLRIGVCLALLVPLLWFGSAQPLAHAATLCSEDDIRTGVGPAQRCIAGITLSARGRLREDILTAGQPLIGAVYTERDKVRHAQEYTVQARFIAWINSQHLYNFSTEGIPGGIEWEVTLPDKRRPDILLYDIGGQVDVIEIKGSWYKGQSESSASGQADDYRRSLSALGSGRLFTLASPSSSRVRGYVDDFYIGDKCRVSGALGYEYATSFSTSVDGVVWSQRWKTSCGPDGRAVPDPNATLPAWVDQLEKIDWLVADAQEEEVTSTLDMAPLKMLVLGDSYAAGNGARDESGKPSYTDPYCYRSNYNWASQYAASISPRAIVFNHACSGATTNEYWNPQRTGPSPLSPFEAEHTEYSSTEPTPEQVSDWAAQDCGPGAGHTSRSVWRLVRWETTIKCFEDYKPQGEWVTEDYDVIFVSLGGNDLKFDWAVLDCFAVQMAGPCSLRLDSISLEMQDVASKVRNVLANVATKNRHARIVYVGYPRLELHPNYLQFLGTDIRRAGEAFRDAQASLDLSWGGLESL